MYAIRWHGRGDVRHEQTDDPAAPGPGEILVDVDWCGICGTDVEEYQDGPLVIPETPHPLTGLAAPMIIGHETVGRVRASGAGVDLEPGSQVALDGFLYCGACRACRRNEVNRCDRWGHLGMSWPGGLAEQVVVPAAMAIPATSEIPSDEFALAEPFSVAVRAVRRAELPLGARVAVVGGGTIGQAVLQVARTCGSGETVLADPIARRREVARTLGADQVAEDFADLDAGAYDVVFDCTGSSAVPPRLLPLPRSGGRIVLVGLPPHETPVDWKQVVLRELTLVGTVGHVYNEDFQTAVGLLCSGRVQAAPLITHRIPLSRAVEDGIQYLAGDGRTEALKILVSPTLT